MTTLLFSASAGLLVPTPPTPHRANGPAMCSAPPNFMERLTGAYHHTFERARDAAAGTPRVA